MPQAARVLAKCARKHREYQPTNRTFNTMHQCTWSISSYCALFQDVDQPAQAWQRLAQITSSQPYNQNGIKAWDCQFCISSSVASWKQTSADGWYQTDATTAVAAVVSFWIECTASCLWLATAARYRLGCSCSDCNQSHHLLPGSYSCTLALSPVRNASSTSIELCTQLHCG